MTKCFCEKIWRRSKFYQDAGDLVSLIAKTHDVACRQIFIASSRCRLAHDVACRSVSDIVRKAHDVACSGCRSKRHPEPHVE